MSDDLAPMLVSTPLDAVIDDLPLVKHLSKCTTDSACLNVVDTE